MHESAPIPLTPHGTLEGWQDTANRARIAGWAWDRSKPDTPINVEIYDGDRLLATISANRYRKDLREAGKGDGRHAFVHPLDGHIRGRKSHRITVRIAGSNVMLRDTATGSMPSPVTRHDRAAPAAIPHFSLPPLARWFYFSFIRTVTRPFPRPIYRLPAIVLAAIRMPIDTDARRLDRTLLAAMGAPASFAERWRLHWSRAYQRQADLILLAQEDRITPRWAARQVRCAASLPPGGAILVSVHHNAGRLADPMLAARGYRLGTIPGKQSDPVILALADPTLSIYWRLAAMSDPRVHGDRQFSPEQAGRKGLRLLAEGGYLTLWADERALWPSERLSPFLGKAMPVWRGAVWLAQQSGKPIIPYMVVPEGLHWRLWLGGAAVPTQRGLCRALEECIRRAPGSWQRFIAMAWMDAPSWDAGSGRAHWVNGAPMDDCVGSDTARG